MPEKDTDTEPSVFPPTRWSVVVGAGSPRPQDSRAALERLAEGYWGPVYWMIRRGWRESPEDAKDLAQEFFARLLEGGGIAGFEPEKGRFRSFLFAAVKHFMLQIRRDASRQKRGGGRPPFAVGDLEERGLEPADPNRPPRDVFEEEWVAALLRRSIGEVREEYRRAGKEASFQAFEMYDLAGEPRPSYGEIAARLGVAAHDVHNSLTGVRRRLKEVLRAHVRETLSDPADLDDEMRVLFG
jgi:RNA polymerase sigma-70 factor (ECF subfamily)